MQNIIITATVTAFLLAANAFFVATEFALVKARGFSIQSLADQGSTSARLTAQIQQNLEAYLATCQLGITIATLGLGWVGKSAVSGLFEYMSPAIDIRDEFFYIISFVLGVLLLSSLHIVIGQQLPRALALQKSEAVALASAHLLHIFYLLSYPFICLINHCTETGLGLLRIQLPTHVEVAPDSEPSEVIVGSTELGELDVKKGTPRRRS